MNRRRKLPVFVASVLLIVTVLTVVFATVLSADTTTYYGDTPYLKLNENGDLILDKSQFFDSSVIYKLPDSVSESDELSLIIEMPGYTLLDHYNKAQTDADFTNYRNSAEADAIVREIESDIEERLALLDKAGVEYEKGVQYSTLIRGFEITVLGSEYKKVCHTLATNSMIHISDAYKRAETELVENQVNVYETGIFNSQGFGYDGTGIVVAVLDTGLDYYHSAFSVNNFTADRNKLGLTLEEVREIIAGKDMSSERLQSGLTAEDVYINEKVPFGFDYADGDSEVFPIRQDHGTHVAGIIAGKNDVITGVAPNAQLAIMKIFSDTDDSARASWIIAALEDCVNLGVDVINMSIGTSCGFSTPSEKELESRVYEKIDEMGMSLIVAASNSFNSAYNSDKNGNLPLTSNPDSATIGSPATYEGALAVGSISGTATSYLLYNGKIIYFVESSDRVSEEKEFVKELLGDSKKEIELEFVKIPGAGRTADYTGIDVTGKIALIARGSTTFEEKANVAQKMGAAAVIIYNNVSGDIKMNVGDVSIPVCSISQDDGEVLSNAGSGSIKVAYSQVAGPFMSDFSSWGPGPDLEIKPEITAHGGSITSSVPGEDYDSISGTSMATPNISGVAALLRQYVIENYPKSMITDEDGSISLKKVTQIINRLMMSTADIVLNKNGLPYSVRKQGAGLANLFNCSSTGTYILTYDKNGEVMDKTKIELGDDPEKNGTYTLKFTIDNFGGSSVSYDLSAYVMTEGVSDTKTGHGETTVTEEAYLLSGATFEIKNVSGGTLDGKRVSVAAGSKADVEVTITLSDADKKYLDDSFANGMYVEGFIVLDSSDEKTVDLSVPYLAFYGDWTVAPLFDLTYFDTNKDELDESLDPEDKIMADAYASRPIGGIYSDFVSYLGTYYYDQDPNKTQIAADMNHISLSNQEDTINAFRYVWGGLLRNAKTLVVTITDDSTGEVVFEVVEENVRKSYGDGGPIYPANIEVEFSAIEQNLKNNTKYTVTLTGLLDYGDGGEDTNLKNSFSFPLYADFQSPAITDVEFYTEEDRAEDKNRLYAKVAVYDNHYAMSTLFGYTAYTDSDGDGELDGIEIKSFDKYLTPVYSEYNSTTYVVYELTDYIDEIKANSATPNSIVITCFDYALNQAIYEVGLPTDYTDIHFKEDTINLSPNEVYTLSPELYPGTEWPEMLTYRSDNTSIVRVVGNEIIALKSGTALISASGTDANGNPVSTTVKVKVLKEGDEGFKEISADANIVKDFRLTGFDVGRAYYFLSSDQRDIGATGDSIKFAGTNYSVSMYPSEEITINYTLTSYVNGATITFETSNDKIVEVDKNTGKITAKEKGFASVTAKVLHNGNSTYYSETINIEVKEPYVTSGPILTNYYGLGGKISIPASLAVTEIGQFAFSNFDYTPKTEFDVINDENPETTKMWYYGDDTITEIIVPEGIEVIGSYAFAGLKNLKKVTLPSTIKKIEVGAFYNCTKLSEVKGIENVQFFNQSSFANTALKSIKLDSAIAIADYAFSNGLLTTGTYYEDKDTGVSGYNRVFIAKEDRALTSVKLSANTQSIGAYAFTGNTNLKSVTLGAEKLKVGQYAFSECESLESISINATVIPVGTFFGSTNLKNVTIGKDVAVIGEYAFSGTSVEAFNVDKGNSTYVARDGGKYLVSADGTKILLAAPKLTSLTVTDSKITTVARGAFANNELLKSVSMPSVYVIEDYAFADCTELSGISFAPLAIIGDFAFQNTAINALPSFDSSLGEIGAYAFYGTRLTTVTIGDGIKIGAYAFAECGTQLPYLETENPYGVNTFEGTLSEVIIGNDVIIGSGAFGYNLDVLYNKIEVYQDWDNSIGWYVLKSPLTTLKIGNGVTIGNYAFYGASNLTKVEFTAEASKKPGEGVTIGDSAFFNATNLTEIDLSCVTSIGDSAFYGIYFNKYHAQDLELNGPGDPVILDAEKGIYEYVYNSAPLKSINLSSLTKLGDQAFAYNRALTSVTLGSLEEIPYGAFYECSDLTSINLDNVKVIGSHAFVSTGLTEINLSSVENVVYEEKGEEKIKPAIGDYAFLTCEKLEHVDFGAARADGQLLEVGEGAFSYCSALDTAENLGSVNKFGAYSFAYTLLDELELTYATYVGNHAFMKENVTDVTLKLGDKLEGIGENPFVNCKIDALSIEVVKDEFNDKVYMQTVNTYDIGTSIKIIDGSIYRVVPNGLEFISYCGNGATVKVAEGTVRIGALAFSGTDVANVILPYTVSSIGHKAFYGCKFLSIVTFTSFEAPILEEEYDYMLYANFQNIPATGGYDLTGDGIDDEYGLGIVPYFMWNATSLPNNVYYGANFVDYIGTIENKPIMIRPSNGRNYNSFIFGQYFDTVIDGAVAADDATLAAIDAINKIPENLTLADEHIVVAAREAYNKITSFEQKALVTDYQKLTKAETKISDLKFLANQGGESGDDETVEPTPDDGLSTGAIVAIVIAAVALAGIAVAAFFILRRAKASKLNGENSAADEAASDEAASDEADVNDAADSHSSADETNEVSDNTDNSSSEESNQ